MMTVVRRVVMLASPPSVPKVEEIPSIEKLSPVRFHSLASRGVMKPNQ